MSAEVLVTGGAGFIGSNTVKTLLQMGETVRVLDLAGRGSPGVLPAEHPGLEVIQGDIRDADACRAAVEGVSYILHMAAESSVAKSLEEPELFHEVNVGGTLTLMEAARAEGIRRFVLSSSCSIYGEDPELPKTEDSRIAPGTPYALTKRINEEYCQLYAQLYSFPSCILRYFNVYGPGQPMKGGYAAVIPVFFDRCIKGRPLRINGDGLQTRDFVGVQDVVRANLAACELNAQHHGAVLNIGSGTQTSVKDLAHVISDLVGVRAELEFQDAIPGEVRHSVSDVQAASDLLGWEPRVTITEGLQETMAWIQSTST